MDATSGDTPDPDSSSTASTGGDATTSTGGPDATTGSDSEDPTTGSDTDGTGGSLDPAAICEDYENVYDDCIAPEYAREEYCDSYTLDYLSSGEPCANATLEWFACLSQLDCAEINAPEDIPCRSTYESAHKICPEGFGVCADEENTWNGDNSCTYEFSQCLDGSEYRIDCVPNGASSTCTCTTDGTTSGMFDVGTAKPDCFGSEYRQGAEDSCGFPAGLVPLD